jgi:hypothetical protein
MDYDENVLNYDGNDLMIGYDKLSWTMMKMT